MTLKDALLESQGALLESIDKRLTLIRRPIGSARSIDARRTATRELADLRAAYERIEQEYQSLERAEKIEEARRLLEEELAK